MRWEKERRQSDDTDTLGNAVRRYGFADAELLTVC
jgi:hypothetical protein